jgi:hypothetical protein
VHALPPYVSGSHTNVLGVLATENRQVFWHSRSGAARPESGASRTRSKLVVYWKRARSLVYHTRIHGGACDRLPSAVSFSRAMTDLDISAEAHHEVPVEPLEQPNLESGGEATGATGQKSASRAVLKRRSVGSSMTPTVSSCASRVGRLLGRRAPVSVSVSCRRTMTRGWMCARGTGLRSGTKRGPVLRECLCLCSHRTCTPRL